MQYREFRDLRTGKEEIRMQSQNFFNILLNMQSDSDIYEAWEKDY